jgi:hypothetical protein
LVICDVHQKKWNNITIVAPKALINLYKSKLWNFDPFKYLKLALDGLDYQELSGSV